MSERNEKKVAEAEASAKKKSIMAAVADIHWGKVIWDTVRGLLVGAILMMMKGDS